MKTPVTVAVCVFAASVAPFAAIHDPVRINAGLVSGTNGAGPEIRVYKGIPYAATPLGALRWRERQSQWKRTPALARLWKEQRLA